MQNQFKDMHKSYIKINMTTITTNANEDFDTCEHTCVAVECASKVCMDCGKETDKEPTYEKEWRFYSDQKPYDDTTRCQRRKNESKTIFKDLENLGFSDEIIHMANETYQKVTQGKTYRGNSRKSVIFACVFSAYKMSNNPQTCDNLIRIFNMKRKNGLKGLKFIHLNIDKESQIKNIRITPCHIISDMMQKFVTTKNLQEQITEIYAIYDYIRDNSLMLNRSRPNSIAAGILYYYILRTHRPITLKAFSSSVEMSELTIKKDCQTD